MDISNIKTTGTKVQKEGENMTEYMSYLQAMKYLGFNSRNYPALRRYIAAGLPVIDVNGSKRISKTAIDKFMAEHQTAATSETGQSKGA